MDHKLEDSLLSAVAQEKFHTTFSRPSGWEDWQGEMIDTLCNTVTVNQSAWCLKAHPAPGKFVREGMHKFEDATILAVMLTKGLEIPAEQDEVAPGVRNPACVGISIKGIVGPALI